MFVAIITTQGVTLNGTLVNFTEDPGADYMLMTENAQINL